MEGSPRIVFMGTPEFAVAQLKAIVDRGYNVVGVITVPDKPAGRGLQLQQSAVKKYALSQGLNLLQPEKLKDPSFVEQFDQLKPDIAVVVAFRMLPEVIWSKPKLGTFNLHASLLPQYRGAAPINWAIINGETETGVTTFLIDNEIDTGKILLYDKIKIEEIDTAGMLHDKLMTIGANLVIKTINGLAKGEIKPVAQANITATHLKPAPKLFKETCKIAWDQPVEHVYNLIRGLCPYPAAWTNFELSNGEVIGCKIFDVSKVEKAHSHTPGSILTDSKSYIHIACADGYIDIRSLQLAGKKMMTTPDLLRGMQNSQLNKTI